MIEKIINKILRKFNYVIIKNDKSDFKKSYSQCGEDLIIDYLFKLRGVYLPTYLDIGANHPYHFSNTAIFYEKGSKGINIEANPELIENFKISRPDDTNLNIGIANEIGLLDFYVMDDNTLSSFSKTETEELIKHGKKFLKTEKIEVTTLPKIIEEFNGGVFPDFLSIDVEGLDFEILRTIDFSIYSPKIICVEAAEYSPIGAGARKNDLINYLTNNGYYEYANTNLNAILVRNSFWFK